MVDPQPDKPSADEQQPRWFKDYYTIGSHRIAALFTGKADQYGEPEHYDMPDALIDRIIADQTILAAAITAREEAEHTAVEMTEIAMRWKARAAGLEAYKALAKRARDLFGVAEVAGLWFNDDWNRDYDALSHPAQPDASQSAREGE
jgi:hypothetical protein